MNNWLVALSAASVVAWVVLVFFRWRFWTMDQRLPAIRARLDEWPGVTALVPARNEEDTIAACLTALAAQDYAGAFRVVVINDDSTDLTRETAVQASGSSGRIAIEVLDAPPLEAGWAGKLWALQHGLERVRAAETSEDFLWLTDADVVHAPDTLSRLVAHAQAGDRALVSLMVKLTCSGFWERMLVPAFIFFFQMLYPFRAVNDRRSRIAGAAGGCILVRADALREAGGLAAVKEALIDDCALARLIKKRGHDVWLGLGESSSSLRPYSGLAEFWRMVARSAFVQLRFSYILLTISMIGMAIAFLSAPVVIISFFLHENIWALGLSGLSWTMMSLAYVPCLRYHGLSGLRAPFLPFAAFLYLLMTIHSAARYLTGTGSNWKNRAYAPK